MWFRKCCGTCWVAAWMWTKSRRGGFPCKSGSYRSWDRMEGCNGDLGAGGVDLQGSGAKEAALVSPGYWLGLSPVVWRRRALPDILARHPVRSTADPQHPVPRRTVCAQFSVAGDDGAHLGRY